MLIIHDTERKKSFFHSTCAAVYDVDEDVLYGPYRSRWILPDKESYDDWGGSGWKQGKFAEKGHCELNHYCQYIPFRGTYTALSSTMLSIWALEGNHVVQLPNRLIRPWGAKAATSKPTAGGQ